MREREREREREMRELKSPGMFSNGCDPLGFQQPNLHTKLENP